MIDRCLSLDRYSNLLKPRMPIKTSYIVALQVQQQVLAQVQHSEMFKTTTSTNRETGTIGSFVKDFVEML